jgi:hypothetical protein
MVYKRKRGRRGFGTKRRKFSRGRRSLNKRVKRVEKSVKRINANIETKIIEKNVNDLTVALLATVPQNLALISQGTTVRTRLGDEIRATSLYFKYHITAKYVPGTTAGAVQHVRVMLVWDKTPAAPNTAPLYTEIIDGSFSSNPTTDLYSPILWDNRHKYVIFYDKLHTVSPPDSSTVPANSVYPSQIIAGKRKIKLGRRISYVNTATYQDKNALWLYVVGDNAVGDSPTFNSVSRLCFRDA